MSFEIDMTTHLSDDGSSLGIFLYDEDADRRIELQMRFYRNGAEYVIYPVGRYPARIEGVAVVTESAVTLLAGGLHVVGTMELSLGDLARVNRATVFLLEKPFDIKDKTEKSLLAGTVPLEILERSKT